ncbi:WD40-repeat-containing domain protein [Dichomitus squalens]|uniref:WD40-repeat-containing domain protein n=2 Tax=Dichomitus squalens TaxID=114155 RepID=A0A4Q9PWW2_9APHY|nr:WD40-repeat-containing domain protein [Dichomitus squalens]
MSFFPHTFLHTRLAMSLVLPWEVIERVIDHCSDDVRTLKSFSLTCHQLTPRSVSTLFAHVGLRVESRDQVLKLCDFLQGKPRLRSLVRSITVSPAHFAASLLYLLPNLSDVAIISRESTLRRSGSNQATNEREGYTPVILHSSSLNCYHRLGTHIRHLRLFHLAFPTYLAFSRVLVAFVNIRELICGHIAVRSNVTTAPLDLVNERLRGRLQLRSLTMDSGVDDAIVAFLSELTQTLVGDLVLAMEPAQLESFSRPWDWTRLQSLTLKFTFETEAVQGISAFLKGFHPPNLQEVTGHLCSVEGGLREIKRFQKDRSKLDACMELENTLLRFPQPRLLVSFASHRYCRKQLWTRELEDRFPILHNRNALVVDSGPSIAVGHEKAVTSFVYSADSTCIATGSLDSTIIIWSFEGLVLQEWAAHTGSVLSLAFSPNSRYLASVGSNSLNFVVWDLGRGAHKLATVEGHAESIECCVWSPDGTTIASGSWDATVRLWDAGTFQLRHSLKLHSAERIWDIRFSPDGRWLASRGGQGSYTWNVASGAMRKTLQERAEGRLAAGVFNPESTRLAEVSRSGAVHIWDVQTGRRLFAFKEHTDAVVDATFSPDGRLVLSASKDKTLRLWDVTGGVMILSLKGHTGRVTAACFSPCGEYVASASLDKTVRLWRTGNGSCVATFSEHESGVTHIAFALNGRTLSSGDSDGTVFIRRMSDVLRDE